MTNTCPHPAPSSRTLERVGGAPVLVGKTPDAPAFGCEPCRVTATYVPLPEEEPPPEGEMWDDAYV